MSGFIAVIQNSFWETLDMKTFWVFLVLTVFSSLAFGLIQFSPRENRDEVARDAIVQVLNNSIGPDRSRRNRRILNLSSEQVEKTGPDQFRVNLTWPGTSDAGASRFRRIPLGVIPYLFTPATIQKNSRHAGFGDVTISEPELTVRVSFLDSDRTIEETRPVPSEVWNKYKNPDFSLIKMMRNPEKYVGLPDDILSHFEQTRVHSILRAGSRLVSDAPSSDSSGNQSTETEEELPENVKAIESHISTSVEFTRTDPEKVPGGSKLSIRFLSGSFKLNQSKEDFLLTKVLGFVVPYISGWFGVLLGIIITSNFIPDLLREGEIELLLTKRTPRWVILLGRFLGAGLFFGLLTGIFLCLSSFVLFLSTGVFTGYLLSSFPPLMLIFFMVYVMSAFIGILTQSRILSILGSIFGWFTLWIVELATSTIDNFLELFNFEESHWSARVLEAVDLLLPSGSEINTLSMKFMQEVGIFSPYTIEVLGLGSDVQNVSISEVMLSGTGFIVFFFLLSLLLFYRKEF